MKAKPTGIRLFPTLLIITGMFLASVSIFAQDAASSAGGDANAKVSKSASATPGAVKGETEKEKVTKDPAGKKEEQNFWQTIIKSGPVGIIIWALLFLTSAATLALIVDAFLTIKQGKIMPPAVIEGVRTALGEGDLGAALEVCETNPGPLSNILMAGFNNVTEGFDVIMDSVSTAAEIESEKLMQRVNFLNLCGSIAPMLGLLGTVTGMVSAFNTLGSATGAEKETLLALSIGQALYTTAVGLLIAVPAILAFTFVRNNASKIILNMESLTYDLVKVLRGAEVVDAEEEEEEYDEDMEEPAAE